MKDNKAFQPSAMRCPGCAQTWLVAGARRGEKYFCKRCGTALLAGAPETLPTLRPKGAKATTWGGVRRRSNL